ncbi:MAG: ABC transporter substrate-binding protein [Polyangiaceae bacterium]
MSTRLTRRAWLRGSAAITAGAALPSCNPSSRGVPLWFSYGGKNREALLALVKAFNTEYPDAHLEPVFQGDYFELLAKLRTALHADRAPAITHVVAEVIPYLAKAGVLEPLDELAPVVKSSDLVPALTQAGAFSGPGATDATYGLPFNRSTPIAYLNGAVLDELGLAPPQTWDELVTFAEAASRGSGEDRRYGFACPIDWWFWVALLLQAGGEIADASGAITLGGEAGVEALSLWQSLVYERNVMRPPAGRDYNAWQVVNQDFISGRAAMIWTSTAFVRYLEENAKFRVVAAPLPRKQRFGMPTGGTMFVVPKGGSARDREVASLFLAFMARASSSNEFATKTGYIPITKSGIATLEADGYYARLPNDRVAVDQLEHARPWPWHAELFRVQREIVQPRLEGAVLAREDARGALDAARRAITEDDG